MHGKVHGRAPSMDGHPPHIVRSWRDADGWRGAVFTPSGVLLVTLGPLPTMEAALAAAEATCRADAKIGLYLSTGVVRETEDVRVVAEGKPYTSGSAVRVATWVRHETSLEEATARFAPGFQVISIDGAEVGR
jgi:hypothetical protein